METDVQTDTKTCKRTEDAAADEAKHGDSCSTKKADPDPMCLISFGDDSTKTPALPCMYNTLVNNGAVAPNAHHPPVEVRMLPSTVSGQMPADTATTAMRTIFSRPLLYWSLGETNKSTSQTNNKLAPPWWTVIQHNQGKLWCSILAVVQVIYAPAHFLEGGARCFVGKFSIERRMVPEAEPFFGRGMAWNILFQERYKRFVTPYVSRPIAVSPKAG